jgi:hypothetical protein
MSPLSWVLASISVQRGEGSGRARASFDLFDNHVGARFGNDVLDFREDVGGKNEKASRLSAHRFVLGHRHGERLDQSVSAHSHTTCKLDAPPLVDS